MSRTFILLGLILVAVGLLWPWIGWLRLGRLPGDIVVERQNLTLYFPITSGLLISVALTLFSGSSTGEAAILNNTVRANRFDHDQTIDPHESCQLLLPC